MSLSLAAGGFAVGIVCAIAAVNVASDFVRPVAMEREVVQDVDPVRPIPVYSASSALTVGKAPDASEGETTRSRARPAAKVALPTIGRAVPVGSETDGRGGESVKLPPVRLTNDSGAPATKADADVKLIRNGTTVQGDAPATARDETKVAAHEPPSEAAAEPQPEAKPAPVAKRKAYRRSKSRRSNEARTHQRRRPTYAAPYRAGPVYGYNGAPIRGYYYHY